MKGGVAAQAVGEFEVLVQQVQKNAALVEHAITAITHARACAAPPAGATVDLQELQEHIENHRIKVTFLLPKTGSACLQQTCRY